MLLRKGDCPVFVSSFCPIMICVCVVPSCVTGLSGFGRVPPCFMRLARKRIYGLC